jgi:hypothetical protein
MKSFIFLELLRKVNTDRQLKRKVRIFLGAGLVGCLMIGAVVVWGGIAAFKTISTIGTNPLVQEKIVHLENEIENLPFPVKADCWKTIKSIMNINIWHEKTISENYNNVKSGCFNE